MKKQAIDKNKLFADYKSDEVFISRIKNSQNSIIIPNKKKQWAKNLKSHFTKYIQMKNKHIRWYWVPSVINEMQLKTTMRYYYTHILEWIPLKRLTLQDVSNEPEQPEFLYTQRIWSGTTILENHLVF